MTIGIGGSSAEQELAALASMTDDIAPLPLSEYRQRIAKAQRLMAEAGLDGIYLNAGTNLYYFTGTRWSASERMVGALLNADGELSYIVPRFELDSFRQFMLVEGEVHCWEEHENPYRLLVDCLQQGRSKPNATLGIDESTPFFVSDGIAQAGSALKRVSATPVTAGCRAIKSAAELALMQRAKDITLRVQQAAARILRPGISTAEVAAFIDQAHRKLGAKAGSYFCIVLFGEDTAHPHGVKQPKRLEANDVVLIDTGCQVEGYISDITRTYVFGEPSRRQRQMWDIEKAAQQAAFEAAQIGAPCGSVDRAARAYLASQGLGPGYRTPGCPHRTGHGIGLDIHEWPYLVASDETPLQAGMCFSNEPMLVLPGEFGIRLEDHFYMTEQGPRWFTQPAHSIDDPFCYAC